MVRLSLKYIFRMNIIMEYLEVHRIHTNIEVDKIKMKVMSPVTINLLSHLLELKRHSILRWVILVIIYHKEKFFLKILLPKSQYPT
jgi:hypothetical protein